MRSYQPYVVKQGDYLAKLAHIYDFEVMEVWHHPLNAELRAARGSPDILYPGDVLYLPMQQQPGGTEVTAKTTNRYRCRVPDVELNLVLHEDRQPLANADCVIDGLSAGPDGPTPLQQRTDAAGRLALQIPTTTSSLVVRVPGRNLVFTIAVGHLNPVDTPNGVEQRLHNLGYLGSYSAPGAVRDATLTFQSDEGLEPTGEPDLETRDALLRRHGS